MIASDGKDIDQICGEDRQTAAVISDYNYLRP